ncbi:glycosyltransferase [Citreicella sp. C3M06]|uniref:glycosyltransferase n=1 Tax=Citreicella sp. C3M06 TaxID=2841564 RepID=UPI00209055B8|nr:glycosyltransferase [Citreicella sp. C3M06]
MKVLHLLQSIDSREGGVANYAQTIAHELRQQGIDSVFVTLDTPGAAHLAEFPFETYACGPAGRAPLAPAIGAAVAQLAPGCDAAVVHGLWNPAAIGGYGALQAAGLPWVLFPHGMLDPYFRRIKPVKHVIKQGYWWLWQGRMLTGAARVLFTCEEEMNLAKGAFVGHQGYHGQPVAFCAGDLRLPEAEMAQGRAAWQARLPELEARDYFLFLSRIHPKKACDDLIRAFAKVAPAQPALDLVIAGPDQVGWQAELQALAQDLGIAARVHWPGMIEGAEKSAAFAGALAFTLPSHQENFGIVVAEALSVDVPVLISKQVNIWREIDRDGAGIACNDTVEDSTAMLERFLALPAAEQGAMRIAARRCYETRFSVAGAGAALADVLSQIQAPDRTP